MDNSSPRGGKPALRRPGTASRPDSEQAANEAARTALARALWTATKPVLDSPAMAYLTRRGTWPARAIGRGWPMVPPAVAWIERAAVLAKDSALASSFPRDAAGAMVTAFLPAGDAPVNPATPHECRPVAVSLDALKADGTRPADARWRKGRGVLSGAAAAMPANPKGRCIAIVEGECDALAVVLMARARLCELGDVGEVRCVAGVSGLQPDRAADRDGRPVVLLPDSPGRDGAAAAGCASRLRAAGRTVLVRLREAGDEAGDSAGDLAALLVERTGRFECDGANAQAADRRAWRAILGLPETGAGHG